MMKLLLYVALLGVTTAQQEVENEHVELFVVPEDFKDENTIVEEHKDFHDLSPEKMDFILGFLDKVGVGPNSGDGDVMMSEMTEPVSHHHHHKHHG